MSRAALVDLDGTLLPMDTPAFMRAFVSQLGASCSQALGLPSATLSDIYWQSITAVVNDRNPHSRNDDVFYARWERLSGRSRERTSAVFEWYFNTGFEDLRRFCHVQPLAPALLDVLQRKGYDIVLATNPVFPRQAVLKRLRWAGIDARHFRMITDLGSSYSAKPQLSYYMGILDRLELAPEDSLMIGNDACDDILPTWDLGMRPYFLTDYALNARSLPERAAKGDFPMLMRWVEALP